MKRVIRGGFVIAMVVMSALIGGDYTPSAAQGVEFWNKGCRKLLKEYAQKPGHKAFSASNAIVSHGVV